MAKSCFFLLILLVFKPVFGSDIRVDHCYCTVASGGASMHYLPCSLKAFVAPANDQLVLDRQSALQHPILACNRYWIRVKPALGSRMYFWLTIDSVRACNCVQKPTRLLSNKLSAPSSKLIDCICVVESGCNRSVGCHDDFGSKSCGPFQIKQVYWQDACAYAKKKLGGDWLNCTTGPNNMACSVETVQYYLARYGKYCVGKGRVPTDEDYARIHNGGPTGCRKASTLNYWAKVKACMQRRFDWL